MTNVVWVYDTFDNDIGIKHKFGKYLKKRCLFDSDHHSYLTYSYKISFQIDISKKSQLGPMGMNGLIILFLPVAHHYSCHGDCV